MSEAAACDVRMRVGRGAVTGGSKFVLHALRVLAVHMILVNPNRALALALTLTLTPY